MNTKLLRVMLQNRPASVVFDIGKEFIFFPNPKVCETSIVRYALKKRAIVRKNAPTLWMDSVETITEDQFKEIFKFTFVRNPYDLVYSAFVYLNKKIPRGPFKHWTFPTFCLMLESIGPSLNPHLTPQHYGLIYDGNLLVDFIGHFETIQQDWSVISTRLNLSPSNLPHTNGSPRDRDFLPHYTHREISIVNNIYFQSFELFGYEMIT